MDTAVAENPHKKSGFLTIFLACFTVLGFLWIFIFADMVAKGSHVKQKDYAAEEVLNKELAKQMTDGVSTLKLVDEAAQQFVNEVVSEQPQEEEQQEEEVKIPVVEEPEPVGEEF